MSGQAKSDNIFSVHAIILVDSYPRYRNLPSCFSVSTCNVCPPKKLWFTIKIYIYERWFNFRKRYSELLLFPTPESLKSNIFFLNFFAACSRQDNYKLET